MVPNSRSDSLAPALSALLRQAAGRFPNKTALICGERRVSYDELHWASMDLAHAFREAGLDPGDRVAIHWANAIEAVELMLGCFHAGLIAVPINTRFKPPEIRGIFEQTRPALSFSQPELAAAAEVARASLPWLAPIRTRLPDTKAHMDLELPSPGSAALVLFTSGTTARPKGATHTHATLAATFRTMWPVGINESSVLLVATPLMHASGLIALTLPALTSGATVVLIPTSDPSLILDAIETHRGTFGFGLPAMMQFLAAAQETRPRDVSSLRTWASGGDCVPVELQQRFQRVFGIPLQEGYALSESVAVAWNRPDAVRAGSMGSPAFAVETRVCGPDGKALQDGPIGELHVRSPANFIGYWNDPEATAAALTDGWFRTADLVRRDSDGYLWFEGRCKSVIIRGGSNISPQEVEEVLYGHPAVMEVGVVGIPDAVYGERVIACVALREGQSVAEEELLTFASQRLADYKVPERVFFLATLPKSVTGKIQRTALREMVTACKVS